MPERCDPYVYFHRVRPYIHGWKDNPALGDGLIYEGVAETGGKPQAFRGQTGSQSHHRARRWMRCSASATPPIRCAPSSTSCTSIARPRTARFVDEVRARSATCAPSSRRRAIPTCASFTTPASASLARFRTRHLEYAASYIDKQRKDSAGNDTDVGTGGTPFMKYLKKHRDEAEQHLL